VRGRGYHFSVDDVCAAFLDVSDRGSPALEHPLFAFLAGLYREFGTRTDLYLFAEQELAGARRRLAEVSARNRAEYETFSWLGLGPHGHDGATPPHRQALPALLATLDSLYAEIARIAGGVRRSRWLRLHEFSESFECAGYLRGRGVDTLLLTDKPRVAYRLPEPAKEAVRRHGRTRHGGLRFLRSHLRVEDLAAEGLDGAGLELRLAEVLERHGFAVLFTHEVALLDPRVRATASSCARYFARAGVPSA
jgi:hypothetical protein